MAKPTKDELESAFQEAKHLIWQEQDRFFLAKTLFALHDKYEELNKVVTACDHYIRSGFSTTAHRGIISAVNSYRNLFSSNNNDFLVNVTDEELGTAIAAASRLRESNNDSQQIAKTILNLNYQVKNLESVYRTLERYLHSGKAATEQANLEKAVKSFRIAENRAYSTDMSAYGAL